MKLRKLSINLIDVWAVLATWLLVWGISALVRVEQGGHVLWADEALSVTQIAFFVTILTILAYGRLRGRRSMRTGQNFESRFPDHESIVFSGVSPTTGQKWFLRFSHIADYSLTPVLGSTDRPEVLEYPIDQVPGDLLQRLNLDPAGLVRHSERAYKLYVLRIEGRRESFFIAKHLERSFPPERPKLRLVHSRSARPVRS